MLHSIVHTYLYKILADQSGSVCLYPRPCSCISVTIYSEVPTRSSAIRASASFLTALYYFDIPTDAYPNNDGVATEICRGCGCSALR